jgi:hypothetical protein
MRGEERDNISIGIESDAETTVTHVSSRRVYGTNAERQRAYRERKKERLKGVQEPSSPSQEVIQPLQPSRGPEELLQPLTALGGSPPATVSSEEFFRSLAGPEERLQPQEAPQTANLIPEAAEALGEPIRLPEPRCPSGKAFSVSPSLASALTQTDDSQV